MLFSHYKNNRRSLKADGKHSFLLLLPVFGIKYMNKKNNKKNAAFHCECGCAAKIVVGTVTVNDKKKPQQFRFLSVDDVFVFYPDQLWQEFTKTPQSKAARHGALSRG